LKADGYPPGIQVLCYNCNMAGGFYGVCPHRRLQPVDRSDEDLSLQEPEPRNPRDVLASPRDVVALKACRRCGEIKPTSAFYANPQTRSGRGSWCGACAREAATARLRTLRIEALTHYSGGTPRCACCGEATLEFLALDHIEGQGQAHRRQAGGRGGNTFCEWLKGQGYPPGLEVLRHNCNCGKGRGPTCPHLLQEVQPAAD
jgi:hypothetical protein